MKKMLVRCMALLAVGLMFVATGCNDDDDDTADLGGTGTITGTVNSIGNVSASVAAVVSGATVELKNADGVTVATTTSAADGSFSFNNVPAGNYTIVFMHGGVTGQMTLEVDEGETVDLTVDVNEEGGATVQIVRTPAGGEAGDPETESFDEDGEPEVEVVEMVRTYWCADGENRWILIPRSQYDENPGAYNPRPLDCAWQLAAKVVHGGGILQDTPITASGVLWFYFDAVTTDAKVVAGPNLGIVSRVGGPDFKIDVFAAGYSGVESPAVSANETGAGETDGTANIPWLVIGQRYYFRVTEISGAEGGMCDVQVIRPGLD